MSCTLHFLYPDLKAQYDVAKRVQLESRVLYNELQEFYPDVSVLVNWDAFDPICKYPFFKQRSLADDGLVVCAAYQRAHRRQDRLLKEYFDRERLIQNQHREEAVVENWKNGANTPHPLLHEIDALDENDDLLVGYFYKPDDGYQAHLGVQWYHRGLTKSQCPLLTDGLRLLLKNRGHPRIELANQAEGGRLQGIFDIIPPMFSQCSGVDNVVDKMRSGYFNRKNRRSTQWRWGTYLLTRDEVEALGKLDKYLSFPDKGMPEPWWYNHGIFDELNLHASLEGPRPKRDFGPWPAVWFAHLLAKDDRYGPAFKDVFVAYVQAHYAMFWRYKMQANGPYPLGGKRPLFVVLDR
jgi:hypothetical protein